MRAWFLVVAALATPAWAETPAWVTANECIEEPATTVPLCAEATPPPAATEQELVSCGCELLGAGGVRDCDRVIAGRARSLPELGRTRDARKLLALRAGQAALRVAALASPTLTLDGFGARTARSVDHQVLGEIPLVHMIFETWDQPENLLLLDLLDSVWKAVARAAGADVPAATARCHRLLAAVRAPDAGDTRRDLVCSLAAADPTTVAAPLAPRWPWCPCEDDPASRALPYAYETGARWACVTSTATEPFASAPISPVLGDALRTFATRLSRDTEPFYVDRITLGACTDVNLPGAHAVGTGCDLESVRLRSPDGRQVDVPLRASTARPYRAALASFVRRVYDLDWKTFRDVSYARSASRVLADLRRRMLPDPMRIEPANRDLVYGVLVRAALVDAGLVMLDPVLGAGHDDRLHVEVDPLLVGVGPMVRADFPLTLRVEDAPQMRDWMVGRAVPGRERGAAAGHTYEIDRLSALAEMPEPPAFALALAVPARSTPDARKLGGGESGEPWCADGPNVQLEVELDRPIKLDTVTTWTDPTTELTITDDFGPLAFRLSMGPSRVAIGTDAATKRLTFTVHATREPLACLRLAFSGPRDIQVVSTLDDVRDLPDAIRELGDAVATCDPGLASRVQLPFTTRVGSVAGVRRRRITTASELLRACGRGELPRPRIVVGYQTDGVTAEQSFVDFSVGSAFWSYRAVDHAWKWTRVATTQAAIE